MDRCGVPAATAAAVHRMLLLEGFYGGYDLAAGCRC